MKREELIKRIELENIAIVTAREFHEMFRGKMLSGVEHDFKIELFKAGGPRFNPTGSSQYDVVLTFCSQHRLNFQWVNDRVLFYRGCVAEPFVLAMETGQL